MSIDSLNILIDGFLNIQILFYSLPLYVQYVLLQELVKMFYKETEVLFIQHIFY